MHDGDEELLRFEERWPVHTERKAEAIREELGLAQARYYQRLLELTQDPAAVAAHPVALRRAARRFERGAWRRSHRREREKAPTR